MKKHLAIRIIAVAITLSAATGHAGLFGSKTTREYKALRDKAEEARKAKKPDEQLKQLEAAHQVISSDTNSIYFKESLFNLGSFHADHRLWWEAEPYFRQAVDRARDKHGTNHLETARAMFAHARTLIELHRFAEADREMQQVEYTARWKTGRYSVTVGYCKAVLGQLLVLQGRSADAIPVLEDGLRQMGRMRSFTSVRAVTAGTIDNSLNLPGTRTDVYLPEPEEVVDVLIDYAIALGDVGRDEDAEEALKSARTMLTTRLGHPMPEFFIKYRFSEAAEAAGRQAEAEKHILAAVVAAYQSPGATPRQRQFANFCVLGYYIRQGSNTKASTQESILMSQGLTLDDLDPFNARQMRLRQERLKAHDTDAAP